MSGHGRNHVSGCAAAGQEQRAAGAATVHLPSEAQRVLQEQRFGVLCTQGEEGPYANLVAFAALADLRVLLIATPRKFENLRTRAQAALLVEDRANTAADLRHAWAVSALGRTREVQGEL